MIQLEPSKLWHRIKDNLDAERNPLRFEYDEYVSHIHYTATFSQIRFRQRIIFCNLSETPQGPLFFQE